MQITIEDFVPYDQSIQWRIHDAYFAKRGIAAWTEGNIPYFSTNNFAIARAHALLTAKLVRDLTRAGHLRRDEEVYVLEVGSGLGQFCANFYRALETACGRVGKDLAARLHYVLSDYSETSIREAAKTQHLRDLVATGRVVPALFDVRKPEEILDLEKKPIQAALAAVIANYICCVTPMKMVRKTKDGWFEKFIQLKADVKDEEVPAGGLTAEDVRREIFDRPTKSKMLEEMQVAEDWRPLDLARLLTDPLHAAVIREAIEPYEEATINYPFTFLDMLRGLGPRMKPEAMALVNDYGHCDRADWEGLSERRPQHYGNTLNHSVNMAIFDFFCPKIGTTLVRTENTFKSIHSAAIRYMREVPRSFRKVFDFTYIQREEGEDMLDFSAAAREWISKEEYLRGVRLYQRCLRLDPESVEVLYRLGEACLDGGYPEKGLPHLLKGQRLDRTAQFDFDFLLGRVYYRLKRYADAIVCYRRSLVRDDDATTHANIGVNYEELKDYRNAYLCYRKALAMKPDYERAKTLMDALRTTWAEVSLGAGDGEPVLKASVPQAIMPPL